ncbi:MAG: adenylate/guanylate cyclase domain-containing protein [Candidatus Cloacimonetes bacterium]|nr:adenylate/guanylate cyclase domain-containing protein [Candidatus Cloacimonadota bacterium]
MKRFKPLLIPLLILIGVRIAFLVPSLTNAENQFHDSFYRTRAGIPFHSETGVLDKLLNWTVNPIIRLLAKERPISGDIVIIAIDDETFSSLDRTWPFPREFHARLIENLNRAGARQIIFDIEFTERSNAQSDSILAATAAHYRNVIFAGKILRSVENLDHVQKLEPITPIMERQIPWGIVNVPPGADNIIRMYNCFDYFDQERVYPLGIASIGTFRYPEPDWSEHIRIERDKLLVADKAIPIINQNQTIINYYGPNNSFQRIPYSQILDDERMDLPGYQGIELNELYDLIEAGVLEGKTVLVGATVAELHDYFRTPFSYELTAGVEIHANFIEMVRQGDYLSNINYLLHLLIEIILALLVWSLFSRIKPQFAAPLTFLVILIYVLAAYLAFARLNLLIPTVQTMVLIAFIYIGSLVYHYITSQKEKRFIRNAFQQYMAPELVARLLDNPGSLTYGGSLQELTVLFSDIRSFTTYSEKHTPEETVMILKEYLTEMVNTVIANGGILDKFVGDEIMALYGTPVQLENHALSACKTALDMRTKLTELQARWKEGGREPFEIGIGINTGVAVVGNLGSEQIFDYTAIGDTINLGARLEAINKEYETLNKIIISEFTFDQVSDLVEARYLDSVKVKGKEIPVRIYELIGLKTGSNPPHN